MKLFLCVLATIACAQAFDNVDWSKVKHRDITPHFPFNYQKSERIVGGEEAVPNSLPYQVGMLIDTDAGTFFCGGSLISTKFVLTAAHCVEGANQIQVRLGAHRINDDEETQVRMISTKYNIHAGWDASTLTNDIATVELPEEVSLSDHIQLISLPTYHDANEDFNGHDGRISGWGLDSDSATSISPVLRFVWTTVISNFSCNLSYLGIIRGTHICTSGTGGLGSCSGDSGGPLSTGAKQIGIVSFGLGLGCEIGWPSAFTRVTSYLDWIESHSDVTINP